MSSHVRLPHADTRGALFGYGSRLLATRCAQLWRQKSTRHAGRAEVGVRFESGFLRPCICKGRAWWVVADGSHDVVCVPLLDWNVRCIRISVRLAEGGQHQNPFLANRSAGLTTTLTLYCHTASEHSVDYCCVTITITSTTTVTSTNSSTSTTTITTTVKTTVTTTTQPHHHFLHAG